MRCSRSAPWTGRYDQNFMTAPLVRGNFGRVMPAADFDHGVSDRTIAEQHLQLMDGLRALWCECMDKLRRGAPPDEWESVNSRLAHLRRQLPD
jgi:hypothetical protein